MNDFHATMLHFFGLDHTKLTYRFQGLDAGSFMISSFDPGEVHTITVDLSKDVTTPGPHTVQYVSKSARSPVATFTVGAAKP